MKKRCYVYYDKNSGYITSIVKKKRPGRGYFIECDINDVIGFLENTVNIQDYVVAYKKDEDKTIMMKKENIVRLRQESQKLFKIPNRRTDSELVLVYYPDNILEIRLNMELISPLYMTDFRNEIKFEKGTELRIFVNNKISGDVYGEFLIDAQELLERGVMFFRLPDECFPKNVSFYTYKLLNSYSWSVGKNKMKSPFNDNIKFDIHKADLERKKDFQYHLVFVPNGKYFVVYNYIKDLQLARVHGYLQFFITDRYDPHILHNKFIITEEMLKLSKFNIVFEESMDMKDKTILYNHKYISVLLELK